VHLISSTISTSAANVHCSLYVNDGRIGIGLCIRHFIIQISRRPTSPSARSPAWLYLGLLRVDRSALCIRYRLAKPERDRPVSQWASLGLILYLFDYLIIAIDLCGRIVNQLRQRRYVSAFISLSVSRITRSKGKVVDEFYFYRATLCVIAALAVNRCIALMSCFVSKWLNISPSFFSPIARRSIF